MTTTVDVVIPTLGRPSLRVLLDALAAARGPLPARIVLVDDRRVPGPPLFARLPVALAGRVEVWRGLGRGPAAARNVGWSVADAPWVAFLDDDVVPDADWPARLADDLRDLPSDVAASQGRLVVPRPAKRAATDWERNVIGLETARWATADMSVRRSVVAQLGGFDERFPRAYREDADLGLRITAAGFRIVDGERRITHPIRREGFWISVAKQAGNADDALMRALHGRGWRARAGAPAGRLPRHAAIVAAFAGAAGGAVAGSAPVFWLGAAAWMAGTAELAWQRIAPGPRTAGEVGRMIATSLVLPFAAIAHRLRGERRARRLTADAAPRRPELVLFDRDGTLIYDVPANADPDQVVPLPGARRGLDRLRRAGVRIAVVSNQDAVARGALNLEQLAAVNRRVEALLGRFASWQTCPHAPDAGCECRKPAPGMLLRAMDELGVRPERCALVGDIGADMEAARAAGIRAILVPTPITRREEIAAAPEVARDIAAAAALLLGAPR